MPATMPAGGLTPAVMDVVEEAEPSSCRRSLSATTAVLRVVGRELVPAPPV